MKGKVLMVATALGIAVSGSALAVRSGNQLEYKGSPKGIVVFDGAAHKKAGLTCKDCHNPEVFPKMRKGAVKITMQEMYAGKYCGRCHNGKRAFAIYDNCTRCHRKE